ncbi:uncharacterized protein [Macrobrachium rosenbergii]|uniref:uncharacterized protein n=1 Tax=Macrobrachium rosenbergii TaxID=79674 RepID=UPI0034D731B9
MQNRGPMNVPLASSPKSRVTQIQVWAPYIHHNTVSPMFTSTLQDPSSAPKDIESLPSCCSSNCLLGTQLHHTTIYHPKSNGMVERFHRTLKVALMSRCNPSTWYSQLPWVLLSLWITPKEGLDLSAAEMVPTAPYRVTDRKQKSFLIEICGTTDWVPIDRLKPAYLPDNITPQI